MSKQKTQQLVSIDIDDLTEVVGGTQFTPGSISESIMPTAPLSPDARWTMSTVMCPSSRMSARDFNPLIRK